MIHDTCSILRVLAIACLSFLGSALPEETQWQIQGNNTLRGEHYVNKGDVTASPFPFEDTHWFEEFNFGFNQRSSPFTTSRGQVSGVYNESDYRSSFERFSVERWNLFHESGDAWTPYRVEGGDYFSFLSSRTQSRSLKGALVELQPPAGPLGEIQSIHLFTGANQSAWREFEADENYSAGASWLVEHSPLGNFSLNHVYNAREADPVSPAPRQEQHIVSFATEKVFEVWTQVMTLESEVAHFFGDHGGLSGAESGQNNDENAYFAQFSGRGEIPLTYRLRFERYGQDYRPDGGNISPDRQSVEAHSGWRFASGLQLRGRYQQFRDGFQGVNRTDTDVFGLGLTGPLLRPWVDDLTGNLDGFVRFSENRDGSTDNRTSNVNMNLNKPVTAGWNGRLGLFVQDLDDFRAGREPVRTYQATLNADHAVSVLGFEGSISPGVGIRRVRGEQTDTDDVFPNLGLQLAQGPHSLGLNAGYSGQFRDVRSSVDVESFNVSANYLFSTGSHAFGLEAGYNGRRPAPGRDTDAYFVGLFWTYNFGVSFTTRPGELMPRGPRHIDEARASGLGLLAELRPGWNLEDTIEPLQARGIRGETRLPGATVYETRLLEEIDQRQRLALVHDENGLIRKIGLIIEFDDVGQVETSAQTFDRVRGVLIKTFGNPVNLLEEGEFTADFAADVNNNRFIRLYEWNAASGVLRFGIPRRLDQQVRMEIQHAQRFPGVRDTLWSIQEVK